MQTSDSIVIIPTYNERENIENIIRAVFALKHGFHILVIEDGSPDGTAAIVKTLQQEFPERLFMVERKGKLGLGTAYIAGFKWALQRGYEYVFEMDADFSHNPQDLPRLYRACSEEGADVAIGSRYVSGVNVVNWPMGRVLMSYFASKYVRFITGLPSTILQPDCMLPPPGIGDYQSGRHPLQRIRLPDRNEIHRLQMRLQGKGSACHLHQSRTGHLQNEQQYFW